MASREGLNSGKPGKDGYNEGCHWPSGQNKGWKFCPCLTSGHLGVILRSLQDGTQVSTSVSSNHEHQVTCACSLPAENVPGSVKPSSGDLKKARGLL